MALVHPPSPRLLKALRYGLVLFVGLALGVGVAAPSFIESSAEQLVAKAERSLGLKISVDSFDWSFDGTVTVQGLKAIDPGAPSEEATLFEAPELNAELEYLWMRSKFRVHSLTLKAPVLRPQLRADASHNLESVLKRLKLFVKKDKAEEAEGGDGGQLSKWLDKHMPDVRVEALELDLRLNHPSGARIGVPERLRFSRGTLDANNTALLMEDDNLSWSLSFEESTLDPGHGFVVKGTMPLRDFDLLRIPVDLRFDRRVEFSVGERVAALSGLGWDGSELILEGLTLSRNAALENKDAPSDEPALQTASITLEPDVEATLAAIGEVLSSSDKSAALNRLLKTIRRVDIDRPRFAFARRAEGHNFRDLVPRQSKGDKSAEDYDDQALGPLMKATLSAVERLVASRPDANGRSFRGFLVRGFSHLERRISGISTTALKLAEAVPFRQVRKTTH